MLQVMVIWEGDSMGVKIGNNNRISKSIISDSSTISLNETNANWIQRHPIITGVISAIISALILSLSFWNKVTDLMNKLFGG